MANRNLPPEPDDHQLSSLPSHIRPIFGEYYGDPDMVLPYYSSSTAQPAARPLPTVTTVEGTAALYGGAVSSVEDMGFRMLDPAEYQAAMEFPADYVLTPADKRTRVQMLGNAVTPNAARDLVAMAAEALTGQEMEPAPPQAAPAA